MGNGSLSYKEWLGRVNQFIIAPEQVNQDFDLTFSIDEDPNLTLVQKNYLLRKLTAAIFNKSDQLYHGLNYVWGLHKADKTFRHFHDSAGYILKISNPNKKICLMKKLYRSLKQNKEITCGGKYRVAMDLYNSLKGEAGFPDEKDMYSFLDQLLK